MRRVPFVPPPHGGPVHIAFIGLGGRGRSLMRDFLATGHTVVSALCDASPDARRRAQEGVTQAGHTPALEYAGDEYDDFLQADCDLVVIATPWEFHARQAVSAMEAGKHVALEVPAATTVEDCWDLVNTSEKTRKHCVLLENCCYGDSEMMVLNMVRAGVLGDITHGEAAYIHDLRSLLFSDKGEGLWRRAEHHARNGNLYPTHGLGPIAQCMDVGSTDRFDYLVSMSSPSRGMPAYANAHLSPEDPKRSEQFACGDMNTSLIKTTRGRTLMVQHDVVSPRPYDRIHLVSGTRGTFRGFPDRLCLDNQPEGEKWLPISDELRETYRHPLWKRVGELAAQNGGHGGMDFVMATRLIECFRDGLPPDIDVYDAADWSVVSPLSEQSVAGKSVPVPFPDFLHRAR